MAERKWLNFNSDADWDQKPSSAIKQTLSSDYDSQNKKSGITRILYRLNGAWLDKNPFGEQGFELLELPEAGFNDRVGSPMLIREGIYVALPSNANYSGFKILNSKEKELEGGYKILPAPKPVFENEKEEFIKDMAVYNSNDIYPDNSIEYTGTENVMCVKCAHLYINPVKYRPLTEKVSVLTEIEIEVTYDFTDGEQSNNAVINNPLYSSMMLGYNSADMKAGKPRLIIITTKDLEYGVKVYEGVKLHKYAAEIALIEDIYAAHPGLSGVNAIKMFLKTEHGKSPVDYVLLAGDTNIIPTPIYNNSDYGITAYQNYFSNDCSGEDTEGSYAPLYSLSRIPAIGKDELFRQLNIAAYYFRHIGKIRSNVCLTTDASDPFAKNSFRGCVERIAGMISTSFNVIKRYDEECSKEDLTNAINSGLGFLNFRGHGANTYWCSTFNYDQDDVKKLDVGNNTPIVFSIACNTAAIHTGDCLGNTWMQNYKAVSFLGASIPSYRSVNNDFNRHLWEAINSHNISIAGDIFKWATLTLLKNGSRSAVVVHNVKIYLQLGDPTVDFKEARDE